ncbi:ATP-binding protein [Sporomusa malonica]|uniref:histidine kinase n=1 Tax=Sporomusa malonica TaxID=112901 RepID=A0A1W2EW23_9FIRM|nr:ATP-binding protein [Sporomusa malonica]SMD13762.1 PAS domain S-box-containing protein [Sporomusa malonica]
MEEKINILMIDGQAENLIALAAVLKSPEYNLVGVTSGEEALKYLLDQDFAMILLDVQMSGVNGLEIARGIRTWQKCQNIPIIFVSAISQTEESLLDGYTSGAVDYIFRPFKPQVLRAKVDSFHRLYKCQQQMDKQRKLLQQQVLELDKLNEQLTMTTIELCRNEVLLENIVAERTRRISSILESIKDGFFTVDADYKFTYINGTAENIFGKSRQYLLGKTLFEVCRTNPAFIENIIVSCSDDKPVCFENMCSLNERWFEVRAYPAENSVSVYLNDITERKLIDKEMARFDRLSLIGEMAAGIAHEIRNPMTTVRGFLQYAKSGKTTLSSSNLDLMMDELDRANTIITEFLSLAKNKNTDKKLQSLVRVIESLLPFIQAEAIMDDKAVVPLINTIPEFYFDEKEVRQLILNLTMNGLEAMQAGGILKISTYKEGDEVVLSVEDQGAGINPEIMDKVGTPFFTTKDSGTGLGLAVCYSIAARHQATIEIKSGDWGTVIYVRFKVCLRDDPTNKFAY